MKFYELLRLACRAILLGALLLTCVCTGTAMARRTPGLGYSATPSESEPYAVCPKPKPGRFQCLSIAVPPKAARVALPSDALAKRPVSPFGPAYEGGGVGGGWAPSELRSVYRLPSTGGSGQTVAIVDAYNDPNAESDLKQYRSHYGLTECTKANGCFKKVNQTGEAEPKQWPENNVGWSEEISLDLDMVSAVCSSCHIVLVEANTNEGTDLFAAENEAAALSGTTEISNSWGAKEYSEESSADADFNHSGIVITASAGDEGFGVSYPAASRYVVSVGGTTLYKTSFYERGWFEEAWNGTGGGCSAYEEKPVWQSDSGCTRRTDNDVAAVASPESPVSVYDSYEEPGWALAGGTSVASPIVAAAEALASSAFRGEGASAFYKHPESMFDVTTGANFKLVNCSYNSPEYLCNAGTGYDGPTGNGSPDLGGGGKGQPGIWSNVPIPGSASHSNAVSCVSSSSCIAVGVAAREAPLAESWNGSRWLPTGSGITTPAGGSRVQLLGVSCTASNACTAVGNYWGSPSTLAERWNGAEWVVQSTPNPSGSKSNKLNGVSCASATSCVAVGEYLSGSNFAELAESWNGTNWSLMTLPTPTEATTSSLQGISCTSATACVAVGRYTTSAGQFALAESWNGAEWTIQSTPKPTGTTEIGLKAVSCTSSTACTAVGHYQANEEGEPLVIRWNGTGWSQQTLANPNKYLDRFLANVSCASSTSCETVGVYYGTAYSTAGAAIVEHWNGTEWSLQQPPSPGGFENSLVGLSCTSSTACVTTGSYATSEYYPYGSLSANLAYTLSGTTWSQQTMPSFAVNSSAVSCGSSLWCAAVGGVEGQAEGPAEVWNGAVWSNESPATPSGAQGFSLSSIACVAAMKCTSVGSYTNISGTRVTLAELLKRPEYSPVLSWSVQTTPNPAGATRSVLSGVSCASSSACAAVGEYTNSSGVEVTLAESWNGSEWAVQATPNPSGAKAARLQSVSCISSSTCTAVGEYTNSSGVEVTLAESWNGSEWTIQATPNPSGAKASSLQGIACSSTTACPAVGRYTNSSGVEVTLAERWNGSQWTIQTTPNPSGAKASSLRSVSCVSETVCTAVGAYTSGTNVATLTEIYSGSEWFLESSPNPSGATESVLESISCASTPLCMATGTTVGSSGTTASMANVIWGQGPVLENTVLPVVSPETPDQAVPESATTGTWTNSPTGYSYQWELCNATGGECKAISGATNSTYTPVEANVGDTLVVKVTAKNGGGEASVHSKATNKIKPIGEITEYSVGHAASHITQGPEGNIWFGESEGGKIGKITTAGTLTEYPVREAHNIEGITAGPDGNLWYLDDVLVGEQLKYNVGKMTTSGTIAGEYALPEKCYPHEITAGPEKENALWFTDECGTIGKITTSGTITEYALPEKKDAEGITAGPDGNLWFAGYGLIGKITTSGTITEYAAPKESYPWGITAGPGKENALWFTEIKSSKIAKITTSGTITAEYTLPTKSEPYGVTAGPDGNLWYADGSSKIGRITTSGTITEYPLPLGEKPYQVAVGSDDNIWFTSLGVKIDKITP